MNHAVANSVDLSHGTDHAVLSVDQSVQNGLDSLGVSGHSHISALNDLLALGLIGELAIDTDTLTQTLCQDLLSLGVEQLILQGRAAGVDNQYVHWNQSPLLQNFVKFLLLLWGK